MAVSDGPSGGSTLQWTDVFECRIGYEWSSPRYDQLVVGPLYRIEVRIDNNSIAPENSDQRQLCLSCAAHRTCPNWYWSVHVMRERGAVPIGG